MHQLFEKKALDRAREEVSPTDPNAKWKNLEQSYANEAIASGLILNSYEDYVKFAFGSDLHRLHKIYAEQFNLHALGLNKLDETGSNIFGHVFGKGLFNCDFELDGSAAETSFGKYIASSVDGGLPISHYNGSGVFSVCSVLSYAEDELSNRPASGTYIASDAGEFVVRNVAEGSGIELRNAHILSGIEFINTSGLDKNEFKIYDIAQKDLYLSNNRAIKFKNFGGMPRIKLDLKNYGDVANKLIPDHDYKVKIRYAVADDEADIVGGGRIGVWLHTDVLDDADPDRQYLYWDGS